MACVTDYEWLITRRHRERTWFVAKRVVDVRAVSTRLRRQYIVDDERTRRDDAQPLYSEKLAANQIACVRFVMTTAIR